MKKFYLGTLGCLLAMGASAQTFEPVGTLSDPGKNEVGLLSIPSSFAMNGKSTPFTVNETERGFEFNVYNKSFVIERTIKIDVPESYGRVEIEAREAITNSTEKTADCEYIEGDGRRIRGYRDYYAKYCSENTVYKDEYVYEWLEYMKEHDSYNEFEGWNILEKREVDGGSLFVVIDDEYNLSGFYFKDNQLLWYTQYKYYEGEVYTNDQYAESYRNFYNAKNAVFTEEYIKQYINWAGDDGYAFGLGLDSYYFYQVDSTSVASTGETYFYTNLWEEINGELFPILYFVWKDESIVAHYIKYTISYTGEWVKTIEEDDDYEFDVYDIVMWPFSIGQAGELDDAYILASQTLFNDDAKWEFIRPVYKEKVDEYSWQTEEKDRDGDGQIDYKSVYYTNQVIGYQIINEDGSVLSTIDVAENDYCDPFVIQWDDDIFFGVSISNRIEPGSEYDDMYENYWDIYSINKNSAAIKKVAATPAMRVSPTIVNRNSIVNVTLGGETAKNGGELIITDSNGRTLGRSRVEVGQTNVPVTTDRMGSGVYNITLTEKGKKVENARVVVK